MFKGPGSWCTPEDLFRLRDSFGFPSQCRSVREVSLAARLRLAECEGDSLQEARQGMADAFLMAHRRYVQWNLWYHTSPQHHAQQAIDHFAGMGFGVPEMRASILRKHAAAGRRDPTGTIRKWIQSTAMGMLVRNASGAAETRVRHKLSRWIPLLQKRPPVCTPRR